MSERLDRRLREWERQDREREAQRRAEFKRRGEPWRFTLTGMVRHDHQWEEEGRIVRESTWTLPDIDPTPEQNEVIPVREDRVTDADVEAVGVVLRSYWIADRVVWYAVCDALLKGGVRSPASERRDGR